jgi:AraC-like DNA-binding protein
MIHLTHNYGQAMREREKTGCAHDSQRDGRGCLARQIAPLKNTEATTAYRETHAGDAISKYREYPVSSPLNDHLMCLWRQSITGSGNPYAHRVLPDGCVDIVFIDDERPLVVGPYVGCLIARLPPGATVVGARFHPGRASGLLGHPASTLLNQSIPLDALWNRSACSQLMWPVSNATSAGKITALESALMTRMPQAAPLDPTVTTAVEWLARHPERSVEQLSQSIGMSSRQLRRRFSAAVGYGPKVFQEILRFQGLLNLTTGAREQAGLAQLAADAGYADQAHMTREVHRFSDTRPTNLLGSAQCTVCLSGLVRTELSPQRT